MGKQEGAHLAVQLARFFSLCGVLGVTGYHNVVCVPFSASFQLQKSKSSAKNIKANLLSLHSPNAFLGRQQNQLINHHPCPQMVPSPAERHSIWICVIIMSKLDSTSSHSTTEENVLCVSFTLMSFNTDNKEHLVQLHCHYLCTCRYSLKHNLCHITRVGSLPLARNALSCTIILIYESDLHVYILYTMNE